MDLTLAICAASEEALESDLFAFLAFASDFFGVTAALGEMLDEEDAESAAWKD